MILPVLCPTLRLGLYRDHGKEHGNHKKGSAVWNAPRLCTAALRALQKRRGQEPLCGLHAWLPTFLHYC